MKKLNEKGFTLVELLAVIVILGILLLLAMPAVTRQVELARKKAFSEDAHTIASAVKDDVLMGDKALTSNNGFDYNVGEINSLLDKKLGKSPFGGNYKTASAKVDISKDSSGRRNYTIRVCLIDENGNGFGYNTIDNIDSDTIVMGSADTSCDTMGINTGTAVIIKEIVNSTDENKKKQISEEKHETYNDDNSQVPDTNTDEYRFAGDNSLVKNNYVYFNCSDTKNQTSSTCDLYRIIGTSFVDNGTGTFEERVKLISVESIEPDDGKWNSVPLNDWTESSLKTYLNTTFYNSINDKYKLLIGDAKYYLGGYENADVKRYQMYQYERKSGNDSETYFNINHEDTTYWVGKIALMYASDFGYATEDRSCDSVNLSSYSSNACGDNWIYRIDTQPNPSWLLNQVSSKNNDAYYTDNTGVSKSISVSGSSHPSHPVFYLTANAEFVGGKGTKSDPFRLFK